MMTRIGVGIVGLSANGGWAAMAHLPALRALPDAFEVRGLTASSAAAASSAAERHGVTWHGCDAAALAARPEIDLVVITVKVPQHRALVEAALGAGKMVYCEWPLGNGLEEAELLARLAGECGARAVVGLQARSAPPIRYLRDLVRDGYVGELLSTTMTAWGGPPWGGVLPAAHSYLVDRSNGATMLSIPLAHSVDALTWVLGEFQSLSATMAIRRPIAQIMGSAETIVATAHDQVAFTGTLPGGGVAVIHYRGGKGPAPGFRWEINGTAGDIVVLGESGHLQYGMVSLHGANGKNRELLPLAVPADYVRVAMEPGSAGFTVAHAYRALAEDIRNGTHELPSFVDAVTRHRMVNAVEMSAAQGIVQSYAAAGG